ncbi:MAG: hypothetical protein ACO3X2_08240, partial [Candidatus Nanopelagicales bacterium]
MRAARRFLIGVAAAATVASLIPTATASMAREKPSDGISMPGLCRSPYNVAIQRRTDVSRVADDRVLTF